jgi:chemotaxis protein CheD
MSDYATLSTREIERMARKILPGEWAVERERPISTLLGSCVAVCLYDSAVPIAGMNHFMLPRMRQHHFPERELLLAGEACMAALLDTMLAQGAARHRLQAKAFGGGSVIDVAPAATPSIGRLNADFARQWLAREKIALTASDFLGPWSRKVLLVPHTGDAYCKRQISNMINEEGQRREEKAYAAALHHLARDGSASSHG